MKKEIDHSNHHSFRFDSLRFKPSYWVDEDDNTITLRMDTVDSCENDKKVMWAMAHINFTLTHTQLRALSNVINDAVLATMPKPEIDDIIRNLEESEGVEA
jgi:hypothetical protein